jgi:hypothetical protein
MQCSAQNGPRESAQLHKLDALDRFTVYEYAECFQFAANLPYLAREATTFAREINFPIIPRYM